MIEASVIEIIEAADDRGGDRLNELADEFRRGRSVADIVLLLDSESAEVVAIGAWILGELHFELYDTDELLSRLYKLLDHSDPGIRFHALGAIFPALDPHDSSTLTLLQKLGSDANEGVRRSAKAAAAQLGLE